MHTHRRRIRRDAATIFSTHLVERSSSQLTQSRSVTSLHICWPCVVFEHTRATLRTQRQSRSANDNIAPSNGRALSVPRDECCGLLQTTNTVMPSYEHKHGQPVVGFKDESRRLTSTNRTLCPTKDFEGRMTISRERERQDTMINKC